MVTSADRGLVLRLLSLVGAMFLFAYLLVPVYNAFCQVTGLNGKPEQRAAINTSNLVDRRREITVEFMANVDPGLAWKFSPKAAVMHIHPGESRSMEYFAQNTSNGSLVGRAVPSIAPNQAARYLVKTECFCFTEQKLASGERKALPVRFFIDPNLPPDVHTITLSYTFYKRNKADSQSTALRPSIDAFLTPTALVDFHTILIRG